MIDGCNVFRIYIEFSLSEEERYVSKVTKRTEGKSIQRSCRSFKNCSWTWMG